MRCVQDACRQGHNPCPAPHICGEHPISEAERGALSADAQRAAVLHFTSGGEPQRNPWPRGTRRNVVWTTYFLEATMTSDQAGEAA